MLVLAFALATQTPQVFFGNLHSHTSYSDGTSIPEVAYRHARDVARLDFLAITEHNHRAAPSRIADDPSLYNGTQSTSLRSAARRFTEDGRFVALYGQEFSTIGSGNHGNVFEVRDVIQAAEVPSGAWDVLLNTWIPAHRDEDNREALILLNHPAETSSEDEEEYGRDDFGGSFEAWRDALDARAELINLINGPALTVGGTPRISESEFRRYLNLGFHVGPTADQDNHHANWGNAAETRTGVVAAALTRQAILEALRERRVYASEDRNLRIIGRVNGQLMGARITGAQLPASGTALTITVDITDDDEPTVAYRVQVFSDDIGGTEQAEVAATATREGDGQLSIPGVLYSGGAQYVYLKITQLWDHSGAQDQAWTAPVWLEPGAPVPAGPQLTLSVDEEAELAVITNIGTAGVNLRQFVLVSTVGSNQRYTFPNTTFTLAPGASVTVTSGPGAANSPPQRIRWTTARVWSNDGDPGELYDAAGNLVARTP